MPMDAYCLLNRAIHETSFTDRVLFTGTLCILAARLLRSMDDHLKPFACAESGCGQVCFHY